MDLKCNISLRLNINRLSLKVAIFKSVMPILFAFFSSFAGVTQAEIHKWVDENGKVHYSDKKQDENAETIEIKDKYIIPDIEKLSPIAYSQEKENRVVSIASVVLDMPRSEHADIRIGRITCGWKPLDLYWTKGIVDLQSRALGNTISTIFRESGYNVANTIGSTPVGGSLELRGKLKNVKMNLCPSGPKSDKTKNATFVEVTWTLYDPALKNELFEQTTKGSHNALDRSFTKDGSRISFENAMAVSVSNLLANQKFVENIQPGLLAELKEEFDQSLKVEYRLGDGDFTFGETVENLKSNSVIIKTENGHGSGVLINEDGYILTNAHVVGEETNFTIQVGRRQFEGRLIRKEKVRDVALVKVDGYKGKARGVRLAKELPTIGDELYVIGTPLKIEFQHTITKGILSARRNISGLPYLQTDAAINPGNSGGPVFDASGELIALTVSGMFTQGGASLNINYLIPIDDAMKTLKMDVEFDSPSIADAFENKSVVEGIKALATEVEAKIIPVAVDESDPQAEKKEVKTIWQDIDDWLDEPLVKLF